MTLNTKIQPTIAMLLLEIAEQRLTSHRNSVNLNFNDKYIQAIYLIDKLHLHPIVCKYDKDKITPISFNLIPPLHAYNRLDQENYIYIPSKHRWELITQPTQLELPIKIRV